MTGRITPTWAFGAALEHWALDPEQGPLEELCAAAAAYQGQPACNHPIITGVALELVVSIRRMHMQGDAGRVLCRVRLQHWAFDVGHELIEWERSRQLDEAATMFGGAA